MLLSPATTMACLLHAALLAAAATLSAAQRVVVGDTLQLPPQFIVTGRSQQQVGGRARQAFSTTEGLRPLKLFFYGNADSRGPATNAFLADRLLPAAASILGRSIRVRAPSGPLDLSRTTLTVENNAQEAVPPPPPNADGTPAAGYDADVVIRYATESIPEAQCRFLAAAGPAAFEVGTNRPIVGQIDYCAIDLNSFNYELTTTTHEILHILGVTSGLFQFYQGYPNGFPAPSIGGAVTLQSPQVLANARTFFNCPTLTGVPFENSGGGGTAGAHWEQRIFDGHIMDGIAGRRDLQTHNNRHVLTDQTLSLLQDSGWYFVLYGSQGFSSYGYQGGCTFATGSFQQALAVPTAARYLCPASDNSRLFCEHDHSVAGICSAPGSSDGFVRVREVTGQDAITNCQGDVPGSRCLETPGQTFTTCRNMACSADNTVLIDGVECNNGLFNCPSNEEMCVNPGFLTCAGQPLNDCNRNGDCFQGRCFCHLGFGGDDCSIRVCTSGCPDGSPCPASGFCGVPECGSWSVGDDGKGTPCTTA